MEIHASLRGQTLIIEKVFRCVSIVDFQKLINEKLFDALKKQNLKQNQRMI